MVCVGNAFDFGCVVAQFIGQLPKPDKSGNYSEGIQYIPITDVKPGDLVLSLNEETGAIEPHRINGLLDMGVKPVFKMTTADGRTIRTTGNHPYLVQHQDKTDVAVGAMGFTVEGSVYLSASSLPGFQWVRVAGLSLGDKIIVPKELSFRVGKDYEEINHNDSKGDNIENHIGVNHNLSFPRSSYRPEVNNQDKYPRDNIKGHQVHRAIFAFLDNLAEAINAREVMAMPTTNVNQAVLPEAAGINAPTTIEPKIILAPSRRKSEKTFNSSLDNIRVNFNTKEDFVKYFVAGDITVDTIVSIEYCGNEQVYDIEVEGTHNFVAGHWITRATKDSGSWIMDRGTNPPSTIHHPLSNGVFFGGIIAHNTYIKGAGAATGITFRTADSTGADRVAILDNGNVGIGTTSPSERLEIGASGKKSFEVRPSADYVSLLVDGAEVALDEELIVRARVSLFW